MQRPPTAKDDKKYDIEKLIKRRSGPVVKFRCEATATQLRAMQARGWAQVQKRNYHKILFRSELSLF